ncbi:hypothetical protein PRZ48_012403 [Zasmidium cellare]|uniref:LysM domain-containing protein n=1 Tax=Zasmidium cellare TaxID=395010 RepID=A0ABR0E5P5_ZASCE|nr:hypothetical protein PRZ48_012403 [Zasmidium cellare]
MPQLESDSQCTNLLSGYYVCVGVPGAKTTPRTTSTALKTSTKPTSTAPEPTQSGLAANCDKYYLVASGDSCDQIETKYGISASQFSKWNPSITPTTTSPKTTTTNSGNGINTPTPTQSGMATDCNRFDLVQTGDTCDAIATKFDIPIAKFYAWNPAVGSSCQTLLIGYYVCVDRLEYKPTTTTSSNGDGIATPTPYEPGMVTNCDKL